MRKDLSVLLAWLVCGQIWEIYALCVVYAVIFVQFWPNVRDSLCFFTF